jgi:hypothetical protein
MASVSSELSPQLSSISHFLSCVTQEPREHLYSELSQILLVGGSEQFVNEISSNAIQPFDSIGL